MSEEEQIIYDEIIKLFTEHKFLSINGTPMTLNEVNNYITNLQQENKQLKEEIENKPDTKWTLTTEDGKELTIIQSERIDMQEELNNTITKLFNQLKNKDSILTELEEWLEMMEEKETIGTYSMVQDKIQELKEKYK